MGYAGKARAEAQQAWTCRSIFPRKSSCWSRDSTAGRFPTGQKPCRCTSSVPPLSGPSRLWPAAGLGADVHQPGSVQTLETLRHLPPPSGDDARIDMMEASALINTDFTRARSAAQRAIDKANAQGSHLLVARTYGILCQQGPSIGASADTVRECEIALQSSIAAGDMNGEAMMLTDLAILYYQEGDLMRAEKMWRQAIQQFRQIGNPDGVATALATWGRGAVQGDLSEAKKLLRVHPPLSGRRR